MIGAFETSVPPLFHEDFKKAKSGAVQEAAITSALILTVNNIEIKSNIINIKGDIFKKHFLSRLTTPIDKGITYIRIKISNFGNFHTTWRKVMNPSAPLGFLTFLTPIEIIEYGLIDDVDTIEENDNIVINIQFERVGESLFQEIIGLHLCNYCGKKINNERLRAVPDTFYCVNCMKLKEKRRK